jgi:outer membrane immunogenic protein
MLTYTVTPYKAGQAMRKFLGTAAILTVFATSAMAADLAVRAPARYVAPVSVYNWTGFYVGIEGGGGWGFARQRDALGFNSGGYNVSGGLVGGTLGYNWQINRLVLGLEADEAWADIRGSTNTLICGGAPPNCSSNLRSLGTFRGRVGWAGVLWWNNVMPYVTGGLAWGSLHGSEGDVLANGAFGSGTTTRAGWTVGGGIEAMLTPNWTAKLEYLYVDFRGDVFNDVVPGFGVVPQSIDFRANVVRAGLNYKFDWYRPFVTK